jgi:hypothetical protein
VRCGRLTGLASEGEIMSESSVIAPREYFHVVGLKGYHPNNLWTRRPNGLYDLSGSAYAFDDVNVRRCLGVKRSGTCECPPAVAE